jgi:hypothetical protein
MEGLIEGRIVHYVAFNNRHLAAIVIGVTPDEVKGDWVTLPTNRVDLALFTNMANSNRVKNFGLQFHQDIGFSADPKPGTWHWVEKV